MTLPEIRCPFCGKGGYGLVRRVLDEVVRQHQLWGDQSHKSAHDWLAILVEEVGEVAHAINEGDRKNLIEELTQVAAVALSALSVLK